MRDEKLVSAAVKSKQSVERVVWVWGAILESASEVQEGGKYEFDTDEAAYFLRCEVADIVSVINALETLGRIAEGVVVRWGDRQYESDKSNERVRRHREQRADNNKHEKQDSNNRNTGCNADVTASDRYVTPPETETETERKNAREALDIFWEVCPKKVGKGAAKKAWKGAILKTSPETIIAAMRVFASKQAGQDEKYIPHPATWLNQERWQDADLQSHKLSGVEFLPSKALKVPVFDDSEAWQAWKKVKPGLVARDIRCDDGRIRHGWYFPSEFPPTQSEAAA